MRKESNKSKNAAVLVATLGVEPQVVTITLDWLLAAGRGIEQTVANQLRNVYEKLREWLDYPEHNVDRNVLIADFAPYFALAESEG